jgi:hypothetical protein
MPGLSGQRRLGSLLVVPHAVATRGTLLVLLWHDSRPRREFRSKESSSRNGESSSRSDERVSRSNQRLSRYAESRSRCEETGARRDKRASRSSPSASRGSVRRPRRASGSGRYSKTLSNSGESVRTLAERAPDHAESVCRSPWRVARREKMFSIHSERTSRNRERHSRNHVCVSRHTKLRRGRDEGAIESSESASGKTERGSR